jgi:hypothetical protein
MPPLFPQAAESSAVPSRDLIRYVLDRDDDDDVCMMGLVFER